MMTALCQEVFAGRKKACHWIEHLVSISYLEGCFLFSEPDFSSTKPVFYCNAPAFGLNS